MPFKGSIWIIWPTFGQQAARDFLPSLWTAEPEGLRQKCGTWSSSGWTGGPIWPWWGSRPDDPHRPPRPGAWPPRPAGVWSRVAPRYYTEDKQNTVSTINDRSFFIAGQVTSTKVLGCLSFCFCFLSHRFIQNRVLKVLSSDFWQYSVKLTWYHRTFLHN